jgi:hypothetical protein
VVKRDYLGKNDANARRRLAGGVAASLDGIRRQRLRDGTPIYRDDAILDYPQSGERIRGRHNIQASRTAQPNTKRFTLRRMLGGGDLWITELVMTYDSQPFYVVSIMEFEGTQVVHETQYFSDAFEPGPSRAQWVERMSETPAGS